MLLSTLFSLPDDLSLVDVHLENEELTLLLRSRQTSATCPECAQPSPHVHGHYTRQLSDLPCLGKVVRVHLEVRRFACRTRGCSRTTFAERFPMLTLPYARRTQRQADALKAIAFAEGGKAGTLQAKRLAMSASRDTLLRLIRSTTLPKRKTPQVLGLDDFAWKKGDRYGTLLVDLQAHAPIEMLPDREAATVARWLRTHPGVKLISRDRAGTYAEGAKRGAPRAKQIADRYHLLVNLRDAIKGSLVRYQDRLPVLAAARTEPPLVSEHPTSSEEMRASSETIPLQDSEKGSRGGTERATQARPLTMVEQRRQISRANRLARYEQILTLHRQGVSQRAIARQLHVSRKVVHHSVTAGSFPERATSSRRGSKLDRYLPYLRKRWEQGCHHGLQLVRELRTQGYTGSASLVGQLLGQWRASSPLPQQPSRGKKRQAAPPLRRRLSPRQASWLFVKAKIHLDEKQQALIEQINLVDADLGELYQLGQDFVQMVKQRQSHQLDAWLLRAQHSACIELQGFARGIKRDYAAVKAGLSLPWSQGQVEGQITRLKLLKRQMYGRAKFDLLRLRVLSRASSSHHTKCA